MLASRAVPIWSKATLITIYWMLSSITCDKDILLEEGGYFIIV